MTEPCTEVSLARRVAEATVLSQDGHLRQHRTRMHRPDLRGESFAHETDGTVLRNRTMPERR
jgi:hypothetical protein